MSVDWGGIIQAGAQLAGAYAQSRAAGRQAQAQTQQAQDRNALSGYGTDKSLDLQALLNQYESRLKKNEGELAEYKAALDDEGKRASNSVRGDLLANLQDFTVDAPVGVNMPNVSGGLRPSLLSGNSRALGQEMSRRALISELEGSPMPYSKMGDLDVSGITSRTAPELTPLPEPSAMDKIMQNVALYGGIASAVNNARNGQPPIQARALPAGAGQTPSVAAQLATQRNPYL